MRLKYEAIDIFSGCGGVSCGLTLAGFKVKAAVEIEQSAIDTYRNYEPLKKVNVIHDDVLLPDSFFSGFITCTDIFNFESSPFSIPTPLTIVTVSILLG